jgi:hypothetical protein
MLLYLLALVIGIVLGFLLSHYTTASTIDESIFRHLKNGKKVTVCIDTHAIRFEMVGKNVKVTQGIADLYDKVDEGDENDTAL